MVFLAYESAGLDQRHCFHCLVRRRSLWAIDPRYDRLSPRVLATQVSSEPIHTALWSTDYLRMLVKYTTTGQVIITYGELADDVSNAADAQKETDLNSALVRKDSIRIGITM